MIRALLLYNPAAGRFTLSPRRLKKFLEYLYCYGIQCKAVRSVVTSDSAAQWLDLQGQDLLVVYGGDGTLHQVIGEAVRCRVPVALLPAGTANVLARELDIPRDPERALGVLVGRKTRRIHLGWGGGRIFHSMAGVGLDADVVARVSRSLKNFMGVGAYWVAGLKSLLKYPFQPFELDLDGEHLQGTFAVIANARNYGGQLLLTPKASVDENCLDVCVFTTRQRHRYLLHLPRAMTGRHILCSDVVYRKVRQVQVRADDSVPVQMDGEVMGRGSISLSNLAQQLEVVVP